MPSDPPQPAARRSVPWSWLLLILVVGLGVPAGAVWHSRWRTDQLRDEFAGRQLERFSLREQNSSLYNSLKQYEGLLDESRQRKDELIREIAEYEQQLVLLKGRTKNVERLGTELTALREALAEYDRVAGSFRTQLDRFRAARPAAAGGNGGNGGKAGKGEKP